MSRIKDGAGSWLLETVAGFFAVSILLISSSLLTITLAHSKQHVITKHSISLLFVFAAAILSRSFFNVDTHAQPAMITALTMTFTLPLQTVAALHVKPIIRTRRNLYLAVLRIAIPGAVPSARGPTRTTYSLLANAGTRLFVTVVFLVRPILDRLGKPSLQLTILAAAIMLTGTPAVLGFISATRSAMGIPTASPFRAPLMSTTLGEFWGGNWNASVSDALRYGVYEPLRTAGVSRTTAVLACFTVSGGAHEAILWHSHQPGSNGRWLAFFLISGFLTIGERIADQHLPRPGWKRRPLIAFAVLIPFHFLFIPVALDTGLARRGVASMNDVFISAAAFRQALK